LLVAEQAHVFWSRAGTVPFHVADAGDYEPGADEGLSTGEWGRRKLVDGGD
jgi:hypothetical protein